MSLSRACACACVCIHAWVVWALVWMWALACAVWVLACIVCIVCRVGIGVCACVYICIRGCGCLRVCINTCVFCLLLVGGGGCVHSHLRWIRAERSWGTNIFTVFLFENNNDLGIVHVVIQAYADHEELSLVMKASVVSVVLRLSVASFSFVLAVWLIVCLFYLCWLLQVNDACTWSLCPCTCAWYTVLHIVVIPFKKRGAFGNSTPPENPWPYPIYLESHSAACHRSMSRCPLVKYTQAQKWHNFLQQCTKLLCSNISKIPPQNLCMRKSLCIKLQALVYDILPPRKVPESDARRVAYALDYLHDSTCNQFNTYSTPRRGHARNVPDECKNGQRYVRVKPFRSRSLLNWRDCSRRQSLG